MKSARTFIALAFAVVCTAVGAQADARESALAVVPEDAAAFVVVHNVADVNRSISAVGKLVNAPPMDLLSMAKGMSGIQKGLDEEGDLILVINTFEPTAERVQLVPVKNFGEFFSSLNVEEPKSGAVEVQLAGRPILVGRKGEFAALAPPSQRSSFEKFLSSSAKRLDDKSLAKWIDSNEVSAVVTPKGLKQVIPKLIGGIQMMQGQIRQLGGENGTAGAAAMNMYIDLLQAAQREVNQVAVGLRIDDQQTMDIVSEARFTPGGKWATWAANVKPAEEDLLAGLPRGPFVFAMGTLVPRQAIQSLMRASMSVMKNQPGYHLSDEDAKKYADLSTRSMKGVHSMRMLMGEPEPGKGFYSRTTNIMTVDDSKQYMENYEKTLAEMGDIAGKQGEQSAFPIPTSKKIKIGDVDGLEVSMQMPKAFSAPGMPDAKKIMEFFAGPGGKLDVYVAPADEHTVVMAYTSQERLTQALEFHRSKQNGLSADEGVAKSSKALPAGSQLTAYVSVQGVAKLGRQILSATAGQGAPQLPEFRDSPPLALGAKVVGTSVEGHFVIQADTLKAIGNAVGRHQQPNAGVPGDQ